VKLLLARGAYVNAKDEIGRTPLHYAARFGHKDVAALLIDNGADVKAEIHHKYKYTPFHVAAMFGHKDVAELLIDKGDDVKVLPPFLLHSVCSGGHRDLAELLIKKGANVNSEAWDDAPSLYAVWNDHPDVLELLLSYGANPDEKDRKDWSLLHYASYSTNMTRLLLDKGADPNVKTNSLETPLHISVVAGHKEIAELLISHGADLNTKRYGYDGQTPLSLAKKKGHSEIVELLRKHGAKESR
jgi:ankyrin repeat protein